MNRFTVPLEFVDNDGDIIKKDIEFYFLSQNLINKISTLFGRFEEARQLYLFLENEQEEKEKILKNEDNKVEKLNKLRTDLKEARIKFAELGGENGIQKEKLDVLIEVLRMNKVEDKRFYDYDFWDNNVDPEEIKDFLMGILMRGKKKVS